MSNVYVSQSSNEDFSYGTLKNVESTNNSMVLSSYNLVHDVIGENRKKIPLIANYSKGRGGIKFRVKEDITISSLGFYNTWDSSFVSTVSIVDSSLNVVSSTNVFAMYSAVSVYNKVDPITLIAGEVYTLECTFNRRTSFIPQTEYSAYINYDQNKLEDISHITNLNGYVTALPFMRSESNKYFDFGYRQFNITTFNIDNLGSSHVSWEEDISNEGEVIIEASYDKGKSWFELSNGSSLPNLNKDISSIEIKQNFLTINPNYTPILKRFELFIDDLVEVNNVSSLQLYSDITNSVHKNYFSTQNVNVITKEFTDRRYKVFNDSLINIESLNNNLFNINLNSNGELIVNDSNLTDVDGVEIEVNYIETTDDDFFQGYLFDVDTKDDTLELSQEEYYLPNKFRHYDNILSFKPILGTKAISSITESGWEFKLLKDTYIKSLKWFNTHDINLKETVTLWDAQSRSIIVQKEVSAMNGWGSEELDSPVFLFGGRNYTISVSKHIGEPYLSIDLNKVNFDSFKEIEFVEGKNLTISNNNLLYPSSKSLEINRLPSFEYYPVSNKLGVGRALIGQRISEEIDLSKLEYIIASEITWNSLGDVTIETSIDEGSTWQKAVNGKPIEGLVGDSIGKTLMIRETLKTIYRDVTPYLYDLTVNISNKPYPNLKFIETSNVDVQTTSFHKSSFFVSNNSDLFLDSEFKDMISNRSYKSINSVDIYSNGKLTAPLMKHINNVDVEVNYEIVFNKIVSSKENLLVNMNHSVYSKVFLDNSSNLLIENKNINYENKYTLNNDELILNSHSSVYRDNYAPIEVNIVLDAYADLRLNLSSLNQSDIDINQKSNMINNISVYNNSDIDLSSYENTLFTKPLNSKSELIATSKISLVSQYNANNSQSIIISNDNEIIKKNNFTYDSKLKTQSLSNNKYYKKSMSYSEIDLKNDNNLFYNKSINLAFNVDLDSNINNKVDKNIQSTSIFNEITSKSTNIKKSPREYNEVLELNSYSSRAKISKLYEDISTFKLDSSISQGNSYDVTTNNTRAVVLPKNVPSGIEIRIGNENLQVDAVTLFVTSSGRYYPVMIWDVETKQVIWIKLVRSMMDNKWTKVPLENPITLKANKNYVLSTIAYENLAEREFKPSNIISNNGFLSVVQYRQGDPEYVDLFPESYVGQNSELYGVVGIEFSRIKYVPSKVEIDVIDLHEYYSILDSKITWDETVPNGTKVEVETSIDEGTSWETAVNGDSIPSIPRSTLVSNKKLLIKKKLSSTQVDLSPSITRITVELTNE